MLHYLDRVETHTKTETYGKGSAPDMNVAEYCQPTYVHQSSNHS